MAIDNSNGTVSSPAASRRIASTSNPQRSHVCMRMIFFVPLVILVLERVLQTSSVLHYFPDSSLAAELSSLYPPSAQSYEDAHSIASNPQAHRTPQPTSSRVQQQVQAAPFLTPHGVNPKPPQRPFMPLPELVLDPVESCDTGMRQVPTIHFDYETLFARNHKIPRIVHQTSKQTCLAPSVHEAVSFWSFPDSNWAHYIHSDVAVERLFSREWPEFPYLSLVLSCIEGKGTLKADLWRYLVLWEYGGVYADVDTKPHLFNTSTIEAHDDGFFVVEQYHLLSQYFMATSPKHPIMYYTIHHTLALLLQQTDTGAIAAPQVTGPHALNRGFRAFMWDTGTLVTEGGVGRKPAKAGLWVGTDQRSIRVAGVGENENEYVWREYIKRPAKMKEYHSMGMEHFSQETKKTKKSCLKVLWEGLQTNDSQ